MKLFYNKPGIASSCKSCVVSPSSLNFYNLDENYYCSMPPHGCFLNDDCVTTFSIVFSHSIRKRPILHTAPQAPKARRLLGVGSLCFTSQRKPRIIFLSSYSLHQPSSKVSTTLNAELLSNREKFSRKYHVFSSKLDCDRDFKSLYKLKRKRAKRFHLFFISLQCSSSPKFHEIVYFPLFLQHYVI